MKCMRYILGIIITISLQAGDDVPPEFQPLLDVAQKLDQYKISMQDPPTELKEVIAEYERLMHTKDDLNKKNALERVTHLAHKFEAAFEQYLKNNTE